MEYQGGTNLTKLQWDMIHAPGLVIGIFEKDSDGMIKSNSYFWTSSGHIIYLENPSSGVTNINMPIPNGTLYGFIHNGIQYNAKIKNDLFYGYQSKEGKVFKDETAKKLKESSNSIIVISRIYNGDCTVSEYSNTVPLNKVEGLSDYLKGIPLQKNNEYYLKKEGKHTLVSVENCSQGLKDYGQKVYSINLSNVNTEEAKAVLFEIVKLADELGQTYFEGIQKGGKWHNSPESSSSYLAYYWALLKEKPDYSPESLQKVVESLKGYKKAIDRFNEISDNGTSTKDEILSIINSYFVFGQDKKYLFDAPIAALNAKQRINILQVLVKGTVSGRMNIGSDWQEEDIILEILKTAPADQWQTLYNKFNSSSLLIDMMRGVDNENFNTMCQTILENTKELIGIPSNPVDLDAYLTNNRYLNFDNSYFSRHNNERLNDDGTIYLAVKGWFYADKDIIMPNLKPFEKILVNIVYENDLIGGKTLTPVELPAFYVYALFNKNTNVALFKSGMFTIDVLSLAVGIGEVKLALSTANYLRLAWALGDVAISSINMATYTTFKDEIKSEYPNFHANLWKVSAVWGITNIAVNSKNISKEVKEVYNEATEIAANSRYSQNTRKTAKDIVSEINKRAETDVELREVIRGGSQTGKVIIVKTGDELRKRLNTLVKKPQPQVYKGDFYRTIGNGRDPLITHYIPKGSAQRYSKPGEDALFFGSSQEGNFQELAHWNVDIKGNTTTYIYKNIECDKLLDLTNITVRNELGITIEQITSNSYEFTDILGTWARENSYRGILYPSARDTADNKYFINCVLFDSGNANKVIKNSIKEKILN